MFLFLIIFSSCFIFTHSYSYLNSQKLLYVKNIINNPNTSPHFLLVTRKILLKHYCRWTLKHLKHVKYTNKITLKQMMIYDMERNAVNGFVKSVRSYQQQSEPLSTLVDSGNKNKLLCNDSNKMEGNTKNQEIKQIICGFDKHTLEPLRTSYYLSKFISFGNKRHLKKNILNSYICHRLKRMIF